MTTRTIVGEQRKALQKGAARTPGKRGPYKTKKVLAQLEQQKRAEELAAMDPEIAEMLGLVVPAPASPQGDDDEEDDDYGVDLSSGKKLDIDDVFSGVSVSWLAYAFQMDRTTVKKRLNTGGCQPIRQERGAKFYNLKQAAGYLVEPKVDVEKWIKSLNPKDLPPLLQDSYWAAALKRQKWEEQAKHLWRTEAVLEVFGRVAKDMKTSITLFADNIERQVGMTPQQRKLLTEQCDGLLEALHNDLITQPKRASTPSTLSELDHAADPEPEAEAELDD